MAADEEQFAGWLHGCGKRADGGVVREAHIATPAITRRGEPLDDACMFQHIEVVSQEVGTDGEARGQFAGGAIAGC